MVGNRDAGRGKMCSRVLGGTPAPETLQGAASDSAWIRLVNSGPEDCCPFAKEQNKTKSSHKVQSIEGLSTFLSDLSWFSL